MLFRSASALSPTKFFSLMKISKAGATAPIPMAILWGENIFPVPAAPELAAANHDANAPFPGFNCAAAAVCNGPKRTLLFVPEPVIKPPIAVSYTHLRAHET